MRVSTLGGAAPAIVTDNGAIVPRTSVHPTLLHPHAVWAIQRSLFVIATATQSAVYFVFRLTVVPHQGPTAVAGVAVVVLLAMPEARAALAYLSITMTRVAFVAILAPAVVAACAPIAIPAFAAAAAMAAAPAHGRSRVHRAVQVAHPLLTGQSQRVLLWIKVHVVMGVVIIVFVIVIIIVFVHPMVRLVVLVEVVHGIHAMLVHVMLHDALISSINEHCGVMFSSRIHQGQGGLLITQGVEEGVIGGLEARFLDQQVEWSSHDTRSHLGCVDQVQQPERPP